MSCGSLYTGASPDIWIGGLQISFEGVDRATISTVEGDKDVITKLVRTFAGSDTPVEHFFSGRCTRRSIGGKISTLKSQVNMHYYNSKTVAPMFPENTEGYNSVWTKCDPAEGNQSRCPPTFGHSSKSMGIRSPSPALSSSSTTPSSTGSRSSGSQGSRSRPSSGSRQNSLQSSISSKASSTGSGDRRPQGSLLDRKRGRKLRRGRSRTPRSSQSSVPGGHSLSLDATSDQQLAEQAMERWVDRR